MIEEYLAWPSGEGARVGAPAQPIVAGPNATITTCKTKHMRET